MTKYDLELKITIVNEYLSGTISYPYLAKKYRIRVSDIQDWVMIYKTNGIEGLKPKKYN